MLRLQAQSRMQPIRFAALALDRTIPKVAAVELDSPLVGRNFQNPATARIVEFRGFCHFSSATIQDPVVVVAMSPMKLFPVRVNAGSDGSGLAEIERRGFDRFQFNGRNEAGVHWGEARRVQGERMVQDFAPSREIEIRMIREIDHGVFVGGGRIFNPQLALHQRVPNHR